MTTEVIEPTASAAMALRGYDEGSRYRVEALVGVETYRIGAEATITLHPATGYVAVSCAYHRELNGCHWWNARGARSLHEFLGEISRDYTLGKLFGTHSLKEFDLEKTVEVIKAEIINWRRSGGLNEEQARDLWMELELCETPDDVARLSAPHGETFYESIAYSEKRCAAWFWDNVWKAFIGHLKEMKA
jgi:hypothetical protein